MIYWPDRYVGILIISLLFLLFTGCHTKGTNQKNWRELPVLEYQEAVYAFWIGQIIGNTYGLGYEFSFIDEPGPDDFPYGYSFTLNDLKKYNGAFSDDDTDIEYMYLIQMEKYGIEPSYFQLAEAWKTHVNKRVWFANRMAVTLMHAGHYPPVTGMIGFNSEWFQIDPQLVNEIWAVTAPGMVDYAKVKSEFSARITSDSFGLEPTLHYAAMFSAAFFEKDVNKLIAIGNTAIPENGRFYKAVQDVKYAYETYPDNWQKARELIKNKYYRVKDYNGHSWAAVDAILNGAYGIMALYYGQGDFQKTLDYCCAFGMDADNQAATMCGLLGVVGGLESIPYELMFPIEGAGWQKPFNDSYKMVTRKGLDDASITGMAERTALQGEKIILARGGKIIEKNGKSFYRINTRSQFSPPFELNSVPAFFTEVNLPFSYPLYTGVPDENSIVETSGEVPPGIVVYHQKIEGIPTETGIFEFVITVNYNKLKKSIPVKMVVFSKNIAGKASQILFNENAIDSNIEMIRDEKTDQTYYSIKQGDIREVDFYGYLWDKEQEISAIGYNPGAPHEFSGWFTSFAVESLNNGNWRKVDNALIQPGMNLDNSQWLKPAYMNYIISFSPVKTNGIRIIGLPGGIEKDAANIHMGIQFYSSISELQVFPR